MKYRILEAWRDFARHVFPLDQFFSEIQKEEMKKAFYAGVFWMISENDKLIDLPEKEGVKILEEIYQECNEYYEKIKEKISDKTR